MTSNTPTQASASASAQSQVTTSMLRAIAEEDTASIRALIESGENINMRVGLGFTALQKAVYIGKLESAQTLLDLGADPDLAGGPAQVTALHNAAKKSNVDMTNLLLRYRADVKIKDDDGATPLHAAAAAGAVEVAKLLVQAGADIVARNNLGETPRDVAAKEAANAKAAEYLQQTEIAHGLNPELETLRRATVAQDMAALKSRLPIGGFRLKR
ncbi:MAG: ankyrin repeat domain-containing protein [Alphaproteobacteria bacterium]